MAHTLIICPTFNHADTLFMSVASARAQTVTDWEMHVILDGAPDRTHQVIDALCKADHRIRHSSHPKAARTGEEYRDPVIRQSNADFVVHLGDDDIWSPWHLSSMIAMLERADWVNEAALSIGGNGAASWIPINSGVPAMRCAAAEKRSPTPGLNAVGYRRSVYLEMAVGWTSTPWADGPSDRAMWSRFFAEPSLSVASTGLSTVFRLPSTAPARYSLTPEARMAELGPVLARAATPGHANRLIREATVLNQAARLFLVQGQNLPASLDAAMRQAGLAAGPQDAEFNIAIDGAPMILPLSGPQRTEFEIAYAVVRQYVAGEPMETRYQDWLRKNLPAWIALVRTVLETSEPAAMNGADHVAQVLGDTVESVSLRANLLAYALRFEAAERVLADCERRWPDHPRTRHARRELTAARDPGPHQSWLRRQHARKNSDNLVT